MTSKVNSMGLSGLKSFMVDVETDVSGRKYCFDIVGLPDAAVKEAKDRVETAIKNSGFSFNMTHVTVNLAPADIRKEGSLYDLPIFVALMLSGRQLVFPHRSSAFIGELSLSGEVRRVNGVLPMVIEAKNSGIENVFVPADNAAEGAVVEGINVYPVKNVKQLMEHLLAGEDEEKKIKKAVPEIPEDVFGGVVKIDFSDVKGQKNVKRALEVAAAGGHNFLMSGPPGSGKSMLAKRIPTILPDMTFEESLETTKIYSVAGELRGNKGLITERPFRSPHYTVSAVGLAGGGAVPRPGELSLAHNGVLFLDEFPEFSRTAKEVMRQPLEDGEITISRVAGTLTYPCSVMLVCAMNPCPCGYLGHPVRKCSCSPAEAQRYLDKISGPMLDRIDIQIDVPPVEYADISGKGSEEECSEAIKERVNAARKIQLERFKGTGTTCNAKMTPRQTHDFCVLDEEANRLLKNVFEKWGLSARAHDKILKVARTIADLDGSENITAKHVSEAVRYRNLDRRIK